MGIRRLELTPDDSSSEKPVFTPNKLPLLGDYGSKNLKILGESFSVIGAKLTRDKGWMMLDTQEFRHMYAEGSAEYVTLMALFPTLQNKAAAQLLLVPERTRKGVGAYLATDPEIEVAYFWNPKVGQLDIVDLEQLKTKKPLASLTAEGMGARSLT